MLSTDHPRTPLENAHPGRMIRIDAGAAIDATRAIAPASMLLEIHACESHPLSPAPILDATILALDVPGQVDAHPAAADAERVDLTGSALLPAMVNAHTHLDLTHVGPQKTDPDGGFVPWIEMVRTRRSHDPEQVARSVREGVRLSLAAGVVAVGDIAGACASEASLSALAALLDSPLHAVSFVEFFATGARTDEGIAQADERLRASLDLCAQSTRIRVGIQPHAPYSCGPRAYRWAIARATDLSLPVSTHLGETVEELDLIAHGRGPMRAFLESLGLWGGQQGFGQGLRPPEHLRTVLETRPMLCAHVNSLRDEDIALLARTGASVAYCPRAHAAFGHEARLGAHPYRRLLDAGVPVALATDSIVTLPESTPERGMGVLDELRLVARRDGVQRLDLITTTPAMMLGLDPNRFLLRAGGCPMGLVATGMEKNAQGPLAGVLMSDAPATLLFSSNSCGFTGMGVA